MVTFDSTSWIISLQIGTNELSMQSWFFSFFPFPLFMMNPAFRWHFLHLCSFELIFGTFGDLPLLTTKFFLFCNPSICGATGHRHQGSLHRLLQYALMVAYSRFYLHSPRYNFARLSNDGWIALFEQERIVPKLGEIYFFCVQKQ